VVGNGPQEAELHKLVRRSDSADRILFHGRISRKKLLGLYASTKALIVPSLWPENAPLVAIEALAMGTPVVGTRYGGLPELLDPIDRGLCMNPEDLFSSLAELDWIDRLGPKCKEAWEASYSPSSFRKRYFGILEEHATT